MEIGDKFGGLQRRDKDDVQRRLSVFFFFRIWGAL